MFGLCLAVSSQNTSSNPVQKALDKVLADTSLDHAAFSFTLIDLEKDSLIATHNPNQSMVPASTMKLITTCSALEILGADTTFTTRIEYTGKIDSATKVLHGDLIIRGGGDPALGSKYFKDHYQKEQSLIDQWAKAILALGVDSVTGCVIGDDGFFDFDPMPSSWIWGDMGNYYGASPSGLTIYDNLVELEFTSGPNAGDATKITGMNPEIPGLKFRNHVLAENISSDEAYVFGAPYSYDRFVRGSIPKGRSGFKVKASIPDPALLAAQQLQEALQTKLKFGTLPTTVRLLNQKKKYEDKKGKLIVATVSPTLAEIVEPTNMKSVNLFTEHLINQIGFHVKGKADYFSGSEAIIAHWKEQGLDVSGLYISDGSGLSRFNAVSSYHLTGILALMHKSKNRSALLKSLPVAGRSGSIRGLCRGTKAENNLTAKSGYMTRVRSYAGYVTSKSGKKMAFAMVVNNYTCSAKRMKKLMEKLMIASAEVD